MRDFRELVVWRRGHRFALGVYRVTRAFPRHELFGVTAQLRRSATSIPTNIARDAAVPGTETAFHRKLPAPCAVTTRQEPR
ncbi:MAG: four helix bundle protein [Pseudomonadota bacterium]